MELFISMTFRPIIMNNRFKTLLLFGVVAVLCGSGYGITSSTASAQSNYSLKVNRDTAGDFTVSNGASFVGSNFDTTYTITGPALDFTKGTDALISAITDDFDKSPNIGYIKMNSASAQAGGNATGNATGLANPFVSQDQINQKIKSVLTYAIDKIEKPQGITLQIGDSREIKCKFGSVLNEFWCDIPTFSLK
jgi:hypothetical protein